MCGQDWYGHGSRYSQPVSYIRSYLGVLSGQKFMKVEPLVLCYRQNSEVSGVGLVFISSSFWLDFAVSYLLDGRI